jgi:hypothetical protein
MKVSRLLGFALLLSSSIAFGNAALADDNCEDQKNSLKRQWANGIVRFGSCYRAAPHLADFDGWWNHCFEVVAAGGVNPKAGHRAVAAWIVMFDGQIVHLSDSATYLGYCAANKAPSPVDPAKAEAFKKQLEELRGKLTQ